MESLKTLIENHFNDDKSRNSFSNLIKKIKLENEFFTYIENYINFGNFNQKLYHFLNNKKEKFICTVCNKNELNWVNSANNYRSTCSARCAGKLTGKKNNPKRQPHPILNTKLEYINYFNLSKIKLVESSLYKVYPKLVTEVNKINLDTIIFPEKVYFYLHDLKQQPLCSHCKINKVKFDTFTKGYHDYCSIKCSSNSEQKKNKIKETCLEKYGVENIGIVTRERALKTMDEKYGGHISTTEQFKEKYKETCLEKYGVEHVFKHKQTKNKIKETLLNRYNVTNPMKNKDISDKVLETAKNKGLIYKWSKTELKDIQSYRRSVCYYTEKTYNEYKHLINPNNLERGIDKYHIDHIYPIIEGWRNKIDPKLIANHKNIRLISSYENLAKGDRTEITYEDFFKKII